MIYALPTHTHIHTHTQARAYQEPELILSFLFLSMYLPNLALPFPSTHLPTHVPTYPSTYLAYLTPTPFLRLRPVYIYISLYSSIEPSQSISGKHNPVETQPKLTGHKSYFVPLRHVSLHHVTCCDVVYRRH